MPTGRISSERSRCGTRSGAGAGGGTEDGVAVDADRSVPQPTTTTAIGTPTSIRNLTTDRAGRIEHLLGDNDQPCIDHNPKANGLVSVQNLPCNFVPDAPCTRCRTQIAPTCVRRANRLALR
jgi:hypothetical protein